MPNDKESKELKSPHKMRIYSKYGYNFYGVTPPKRFKSAGLFFKSAGYESSGFQILSFRTQYFFIDLHFKKKRFLKMSDYIPVDILLIFS
jgi:hypothetical protein